MEILTAISTFVKPIVLAGIGYFVTGAFEGHKRDNERRKKAGEERFKSYTELWKITDYGTYLNDNAKVERDKLAKALSDWYYKTAVPKIIGNSIKYLLIL